MITHTFESWNVKVLMLSNLQINMFIGTHWSMMNLTIVKTLIKSNKFIFPEILTLESSLPSKSHSDIDLINSNSDASVDDEDLVPTSDLEEFDVSLHKC